MSFHLKINKLKNTYIENLLVSIVVLSSSLSFVVKVDEHVGEGSSTNHSLKNDDRNEKFTVTFSITNNTIEIISR